MPSNSEEMSMDRGRFSVPLKHIGSKKWERPLISLVSYLDPASTSTKTVAARLLSFGAVIIRRPLSKTIFLKFVISYNLIFKIISRQISLAQNRLKSSQWYLLFTHWNNYSQGGTAGFPEFSMTTLLRNKNKALFLQDFGDFYR